jgi:hypothetical protein
MAFRPETHPIEVPAATVLPVFDSRTNAPTHGAADLAQMVAPAVEQGTQDMGVVESAHRAVSSTVGSRCSFDLSSRSEPMIRGAGCGSPASPDLWEAGESDLPGPPDIPFAATTVRPFGPVPRYSLVTTDKSCYWPVNSAQTAQTLCSSTNR